jgi:hypothetical protein
MKNLVKILLPLLLAILSPAIRAQVLPKDACRVEEGQIVFTLDLQWTQAQKNEVVRLFDIDSAVMAGTWGGKTEMTVNGAVWKVRKISPRIVELSKSFSSDEESADGSSDVFMIDDQWAGITMENTRESVPYGVNMFTRFNVFQYAGGKAKFYLPGHLDARQVVLSGTFNNWSTLQMPMQKTDSGWVYQIRLLPGKYQYKYIIDGRWTRDPFNRQKEDDQQGDYNSVVFCFNHWFRLAGMETARTVVVAGSFNNWNETELRMVRSQKGWYLHMYLREGTHAYKFLVNGHWITDPAAKVTRPDGAGHINSFIGIGDSTVFSLRGYPDAKKVALAGNFNAWNDGELFMEKSVGGWTLPLALAPGMYEYKFVVDGEWIPDPVNPLKVGEGNFTNSVLVFKPNHTFTLDAYSDAKKVTIAGSFNGWSKDGYPMIRKDSRWVFPIRLKPGKYTYKFVVDGKWILDPGNDLWEENEYGTGNSVIWIEP